MKYILFFWLMLFAGNAFGQRLVSKSELGTNTFFVDLDRDGRLDALCFNGQTLAVYHNESAKISETVFFSVSEKIFSRRICAIKPNFTPNQHPQVAVDIVFADSTVQTINSQALLQKTTTNIVGLAKPAVLPQLTSADYNFSLVWYTQPLADGGDRNFTIGDLLGEQRVFAYTDYLPPSPGTKRSRIYKHTGDNQYSVLYEYLDEYLIDSTRKGNFWLITDIDANGKKDVVMMQQHGVNSFYGGFLEENGLGGLKRYASNFEYVYTNGYGTIMTATDIKACDFDGDGKLELAICYNNVGYNQGSEVKVWKYQSQGTLSGTTDPAKILILIAHIYLPSTTQQIAVGDIDGDGKDDIAAPFGDYYVYDSLGIGENHFQHKTLNAPFSGYGATRVVVADFDGDGHNEVAFSGNEISIYKRNLTGDTTTFTRVFIDTSTFNIDNPNNIFQYAWHASAKLWGNRQLLISTNQYHDYNVPPLTPNTGDVHYIYGYDRTTQQYKMFYNRHNRKGPWFHSYLADTDRDGKLEILSTGAAVPDSGSLAILENDVALAGTPDGTKHASTFELAQNYPNPFNPTTVISYQLAVSSLVTLKVYDVLGREVAMLVSEHKAAGKYSVTFDGSRLASGMYLYRLQAGSFIQHKKMILLK